MKIIITGWAGFIWSNFLNIFVKKYPDIDFINIDVLTYAGKLENIDDDVKNAKNYFFEQVDIRDKNKLREVYQKYNPTDIIHFAAESHVDNSISNPSIFLETNVLGTGNLLDLHREFDMNRFHYISTDEVYWELSEDNLEEKFTENTDLKPNSPYSVSKTAGDMLSIANHRTYGIDVVVTRCSNNYWPNQDSEKLIPHFIKLLLSWKKVTLYGDGQNIRDWLYVTDHCEAIWEVFTKADSGSVYNIWWDNEITNYKITKTILDQLWFDESWIQYVEDRLGHDRRYSIDFSNLEKDLWWTPKIKFEEWIKRTIEFYKNKFKNE